MKRPSLINLCLVACAAICGCDSLSVSYSSLVCINPVKVPDYCDYNKGYLLGKGEYDSWVAKGAPSAEIPLDRGRQCVTLVDDPDDLGKGKLKFEVNVFVADAEEQASNAAKGDVGYSTDPADYVIIIAKEDLTGYFTIDPGVVTYNGEVSEGELQITIMMTPDNPFTDADVKRFNSVPYLDWDEVGNKMTNATCTAYEVVTDEQSVLDAGKTYVVQGDVETRNAAITVNGTEEQPTRLILADGSCLNAGRGIGVGEGHKLVICGQAEGSGRLFSYGNVQGTAGIGGNANDTGCGTIVINGGDVLAEGYNRAAGIGGGYSDSEGVGDGGSVTINGGVVEACGSSIVEGGGVGMGGAGIGGGEGGAGGTVTVRGGRVTACGGYGAAGIGGGLNGAGASVMISGGVVTAMSEADSDGIAGIGAGGGEGPIDPGTVTFGEGTSYFVKAGPSMENLEVVTADEYVSDHSATCAFIYEERALGLTVNDRIGMGDAWQFGWTWDGKALVLYSDNLDEVRSFVVEGSAADPIAAMSVDASDGDVDIELKNCVFAETFGMNRLDSNLTARVSLKIAGGEFRCATDPFSAASAVVITGGEFAFDPSKYVSEGFSVVKEGDKWLVVQEEPDPDPDPDPEPKKMPTLFDAFAAGAVNEKGATYNGFLGGEMFGGTFTLVVKKPKKGETSAVATLTRVNPATGKKVKISGTVDVNTGVCAGDLAGLVLNAQGVGGTLGDLAVQGAVDAAKAKDQTTLDLMNDYNKLVYSVVLTNANGSCTMLTATFSKKGKVKVAGAVDGVKVSCSAQMSVGDKLCAVPFVYAKPAKGLAVSAVLWFAKDTKKLVDVTGAGKDVTAAAFGSAAAPDLGEYRFLMVEADVKVSVPQAISNTAYEVKATFDGKKYDAGKPAKVKYDRKTSTLTVDTTKGTDVSGLKLKYSKGAISGSFTVYEVDTAKQKLVKNKFTVTGVVVDGVGYGLATNKKLKPILVEVRK